MKDVLKPCPFCGGKANIEPNGRNTYLLDCLSCGIGGDAFTSGQVAKEAWNRREGENLLLDKVDVILRTVKDDILNEIERHPLNPNVGKRGALSRVCWAILEIKRLK